MDIIADNDAGRERSAKIVAAGGIVAFRTDTFYGLGADPFNLRALNVLNELKGRDGKAILVLISESDLTERILSKKTKIFKALCAAHWPGALTLVADALPRMPELLTAGTGSLGVRLPDDEEVRSFVRACGGVLTATSANPTGKPPARTAVEVASYFAPDAELLVVDGGAARSELPSTVLDTRGPRLIREGVVRRESLEKTLELIGAKLI